MLERQLTTPAADSPSCSVRLDRGVYAAAQALYDRFLPMVQEHLAASPFAKIVFTGHSLGGSLSTLLMLMFLRRGVIPAVALAPVYTFGSPAIFCEAGPGTGCACKVGPLCTYALSMKHP